MPQKESTPSKLATKATTATAATTEPKPARSFEEWQDTVLSRILQVTLNVCL